MYHVLVLGTNEISAYELSRCCYLHIASQHPSREEIYMHLYHGLCLNVFYSAVPLSRCQFSSNITDSFVYWSPDLYSAQLLQWCILYRVKLGGVITALECTCYWNKKTSTRSCRKYLSSVFQIRIIKTGSLNTGPSYKKCGMPWSVYAFPCSDSHIRFIGMLGQIIWSLVCSDMRGLNVYLCS